ncbi:(2Fe-2S) ferredoxin domain-containing protein [Synechococcus elongatus IITB7]|uniref:(2Fe-2S) ferredoxin domain-containing protein n=1 Tax=Synechococcus elongatus TaxID=32046 RepID=UPI0030CCC4F9
MKLPFYLEGYFMGLADPLAQSDIRLIVVQSDGGNRYTLKLAKPLRRLPWQQLAIGQPLRIEGQQSLQGVGSPPKLKAERVLFDPAGLPALTIAPRPSQHRPPVLEVCTKGTCRRRGALELCDRLKAEAQTYAVEVRASGCLGRCKQGINVRRSSDNKILSQLSPQEATELLAPWRTATAAIAAVS